MVFTFPLLMVGAAVGVSLGGAAVRLIERAAGQDRRCRCGTLTRGGWASARRCCPACPLWPARITVAAAALWAIAGAVIPAFPAAPAVAAGLTLTGLLTAVAIRARTGDVTPCGHADDNNPDIATSHR